LDVFFFDALFGIGYQSKKTFGMTGVAHWFTSSFVSIPRQKHNTMLVASSLHVAPVGAHFCVGYQRDA
jgi:hypothetical protein